MDQILKNKGNLRHFEVIFFSYEFFDSLKFVNVVIFDLYIKMMNFHKISFSHSLLLA